MQGAFACLAGLVVTGVLAELVPAAHVRDTASLQGFATLRDTWLSHVLERVAHLADGGPYTLVAAAIVLTALARNRRRLAGVVAVVLVVAPMTSEVLKHVLATPRSTAVVGADGIAAASWPSGHATASMTLALCAVLVAPAALRPAVAVIGALFTMAVSYAVLVWVWHFPSDVVGGILVAASFVLLAVAVLRRWPDPVHRAEPVAPPLGAGRFWIVAALGFAAVVGGVAVAVQRHRALAEHFAGHSSFVAAALTIAVLAAGLAAIVARSVRSG